MYTRYPESYCAAFKNIPSKGVGAKIRNTCQMEESHSFPISPREWHRGTGCKHIPWAFLDDTATLYLYRLHGAHCGGFLYCVSGDKRLNGIGLFSQKETLLKRINRARICIRICVICVFYKLSIGGFRMSALFFSPFISQASISENGRKVLAVRIGGSGGQMSLPDP